MNVIYLLIPLAVIFVSVAILIFKWAVKNNQFSDLDKEGYSILFDEENGQADPSKAKSTTQDMQKSKEVD